MTHYSLWGYSPNSIAACGTPNHTNTSTINTRLITCPTCQHTAQKQKKSSTS